MDQENFSQSKLPPYQSLSIGFNQVDPFPIESVRKWKTRMIVRLSNGELAVDGAIANVRQMLIDEDYLYPWRKDKYLGLGKLAKWSALVTEKECEYQARGNSGFTITAENGIQTCRFYFRAVEISSNWRLIASISHGDSELASSLRIGRHNPSGKDYILYETKLDNGKKFYLRISGPDLNEDLLWMEIPANSTLKDAWLIILS